MISLSTTEMTSSPPSKKIKITTATAKEQNQRMPDDIHDRDDLVEVEPEVLEEISRMYKRYQKEILLSSGVFQPMVVPGDAIPVVYDLLELTREGVDIHIFCYFAKQCLDRRTLQVYDHPGDPRCGGFEHWEGKNIKEKHRMVAAFALDQYLKLSNKGSSLEIKEVDKMSRSTDTDPNYYVTFRIADKLTKEEQGVFQAQVIEAGCGNLKLGILRDASHDRVLAAIKFKQDPLKVTGLVDQMSHDEQAAITRGLIKIPDEAWELLFA